MFIKWGPNGPESSVQSIPGDDGGEWLPVISTPSLKDRNPVTQTVRYERVDDVVFERVEGLRDMVWWQSRVRNYPRISDQLDAIWKGGEEMEAMRQRVLAVKEKWPKP
jgi:hypothetical protein